MVAIVDIEIGAVFAARASKYRAAVSARGLIEGIGEGEGVPILA